MGFSQHSAWPGEMRRAFHIIAPLERRHSGTECTNIRVHMFHVVSYVSAGAGVASASCASAFIFLFDRESWGAGGLLELFARPYAKVQ